LIKTERPPLERIALLLQGSGALGSYQAQNQRGHRRDQCDAELHDILRAAEHECERDATDRYCAQKSPPAGGATWA
jgi:hypothetical protein